MFRRLPSGLPKDPRYPPTLEGLGYFINDNDEIRSIENPKAYFKYFLTKNQRYNDMQREAMNQAIRDIVEQRLLNTGLEKVTIPLNVPTTSPHTHIFVSANLASAKRVVVLFYEPKDDIGVFAHRILGGAGGVNVGSAVNFCKYIQAQHTSPTDPTPPGIILANMGQLRWWRRGQKAITQTSWYALPQASAVDKPYRFDDLKNTIEGNRTNAQHVAYIFNHCIPSLCHPSSAINIIAVSESAMSFSNFMEVPENFSKWANRITAYAAVATWYHAYDYKNPEFLEWISARSRAYIISGEPEGTFIMGPEGKRNAPGFGCSAFGLGEPWYSECLLPKGYRTVLEWFREVAEGDVDKGAGSGSWREGYRNPKFVRMGDDDDDYEDMGFGNEGFADDVKGEVEGVAGLGTGTIMYGDEGFGDGERNDGVALKIEDGEKVVEIKDD